MAKRSLPPMRFSKHKSEEQARKRQRTTTRKNAFFTQLNYDVRRNIYDHLTLPPFAEAKSCEGLYLSCQQFKHEMDHAATVQLRAHLLSYKQKIAKETGGLVQIQLPSELESRPVPIDTIMNTNITINVEIDPVSLYPLIRNIRKMFSGCNMGLLHIHFIIPGEGYYVNADTGHMFMTEISTETLRILLCPVGKQSGLRVHRAMVTWDSAELASQQNEALALQGHKFETTNTSSSTACGYWFRHNTIDCGACVIIKKDAFKAKSISSEELRLLTWHGSDINDLSGLEISHATMNFTTLEVVDDKAKGTLESTVVDATRAYEEMEIIGGH
ncbi:hypothetical protein GMOD_00004295 [Pyrenophora seminiperda CCB06]|uniref:Uncharacterized protein n=1 Tax=Pyrenophora seminiperda CCB06 TaxID=1302712 RepID=A0A3M7M0X7_9PLEO|nr:hypothetical protein GMOD_00004295 [Pyrenophora seminiperda CCB06]